MKKILLNTLLAFVLLGGPVTLNSVAAQKPPATSTNAAEQKNKQPDATPAATGDDKGGKNSDNKADKTEDNNKAATKTQTATKTRLSSKQNFAINDIIIHKDTIIFFSDIPEVKNAGVLVYGDDGIKTGSVTPAVFKETMQKKNGFHMGITPTIKDNRAAISVKYDSILDYDTYIFLTVVKKGNNWQKGDGLNTIGIKKGEPAQAATPILDIQASSSAIEDIQANNETDDDGFDEDNNQGSTSILGIVLEIVLLVLVLLAVAAAVVCFLKVKGLRKEIEELRDDLRQQTRQATNLSANTGMNDNHIGEIARREANNAVQTLRNELNQAMRSNAYQQQQAQPTATQPIPQQPQQPQQANIDTIDVEYNANENTFALKPTKLHHFRIFSRGGHYFFRLSDIVVGSELASQTWMGTISIYERCILYTMKNFNSTRINIVQDGELRKEGDRFVVVKKMVIELL